MRLPASPVASSFNAFFRVRELPRGAGARLVVDDESVVRQVASALLAELGYHCLSVEDGVEALKMLRERTTKLDGILLDISMPRMSGEECLVELRRGWPELPVLIATGHEDAALEERLRGLGAADVLQRPFKLDQLAAVLQRTFLSPRPPSRDVGAAHPELGAGASDRGGGEKA